jgi:hypothetical protein
VKTVLNSLAPGDPAAAATLARLEEIDRQLATALTAAERKALAARRDELLADTTPEKLQAAAAPLEQRRTLTAEQASIAARLSETAHGTQPRSDRAASSHGCGL